MSEMPPSSYTPPRPGGGSYTPPPPPPPPPAGPGGGTPGSDRGLMLFLSYFGIFALIPMLTKKDDPDVQWHSKNGLPLGIAWVVVAIGWNVMTWMLPWGIRAVWSTAGCFIGVAFLVIDIIAM